MCCVDVSLFEWQLINRDAELILQSGINRPVVLSAVVVGRFMIPRPQHYHLLCTPVYKCHQVLQ